MAKAGCLMGDVLKLATRLRMSETGEKYTTARRAILADSAEYDRLKRMIRLAQNKRRYPFTDRDGLDGRHVLSAWETSRRGH